MDVESVDVVAVGAHPDDVEIGCGGTVARLVEQGYRVGIVDLTDGEPTPCSPGPHVRMEEARRAAETLGAAVRVTLELPNRRLFDCFEARVELAKQFRRFRPRLVLGLGGRTPTYSPDHFQASLIIEAAVFYSRLSKWAKHFDGLPVHRIPRQLHYFLDFHSLSPVAAGGLVVDIGSTLKKKLAAVACYKTQFSSKKAGAIERIRIFAEQQGIAAGFRAGEVLASPVAWGTGDLMGMLFDSEPIATAGQLATSDPAGKNVPPAS